MSPSKVLNSSPRVTSALPLSYMELVARQAVYLAHQFDMDVHASY